MLTFLIIDGNKKNPSAYEEMSFMNYCSKLKLPTSHFSIHVIFANKFFNFIGVNIEQFANISKIPFELVVWVNVSAPVGTNPRLFILCVLFRNVETCIKHFIWKQKWMSTWDNFEKLELFQLFCLKESSIRQALTFFSLFLFMS